MRQIIPFKKELPFRTKVSEITSISLEREINVLEDGIVTGAFHITGDYKMNEGSINRENFSFDLPFDITLDPRYDIKTVNADIEDFYYDVINEDTLKVNIDLFVEAEYLPEPEIKDDVVETIEDDRDANVQVDDTDMEEKVDDTCDRSSLEVDILDIKEEKEDVKKEDDTCEESIIEIPEIKDDVKTDEEVSDNVVKQDEILKDDRDESDVLTVDLFSNLDSAETYTTYYVYIVKEEDTIDKILTKYGITKEEFEDYNDITEIKPGDKVIIPKCSE